MSTGPDPSRQEQASPRPRTRSAKLRKGATQTVKLDLDAEELALHAAVSAAVARDLGRRHREMDAGRKISEAELACLLATKPAVPRP